MQIDNDIPIIPAVLPSREIVVEELIVRKYGKKAYHIHQSWAWVDPNITYLNDGRWNASIHRSEYSSAEEYLAAIRSRFEEWYRIKSAKFTIDDLKSLGIQEYIDAILAQKNNSESV
jgi:hypothetical protein